MLTPESWKEIPGYEGAYSVSDHGRVRSEARWVKSRSMRPVKERILKLTKNPDGYYTVTLATQNICRTWVVHRLVLLAFIGPCDLLGCHWDGNPSNNHLDNLRYGTVQDNEDDMVRHGTRARGETHGVSVLTEVQVMEVRAALPTWQRGMGNHFSKKFGVSPSLISLIKHNKGWSHV